MSELLLRILARADARLPELVFFDADEVRGWPQDVLQALVRRGVLIEAEPGRTVVCDACPEGHREEPVLVRGPKDGQVRAYISCPEAGRVEMDPMRLKRWRLRPIALGEFINMEMGISETPREIGADRLWELGTCADLAGGGRRVLLARGIAWPDASRAFGAHLRVDRRQSTALISLYAPPGPGVESGIPFCCLPDFLRFQSGELQLSGSDLVAALNSMIKEAPFLFLREGDYWSIRYEGEGFRLRDLKGLRFIAHLLRSPGKEIPALDLVQEVEGRPPGVGIEAHYKIREGDLGDAGPALDHGAIREYKQRVDEIDRELGDSALDELTRNALQKERAFIERELSAGVGLGGRSRRVGSSAERARVNVTKSIQSALNRIEDESAALGQFLRNSIQTGSHFSYAPDWPINWVI